MKRRVGAIVLGLTVVVWSGCGGCEDQTSSESGGNGGDGMAGDVIDDMTTGEDGDGAATGGDDGGATTGGDGGAMDTDGAGTGDGGSTSDGGGDTKAVDGGDTQIPDGDGYAPDSDTMMTPIDADTTGTDTGSGTDVDGGISCPGTEVGCNGNCVDTTVNDTHCGQCGNTCPTEASCTGGTCECPDYQTLCNGQCVTTSLDNDNCGSCGNTCDQSQNETCNGGQCVDITAVGCPAQTTYCSNVHACIDTDTNPDHCGSCTNSCAPNEGCASGVCAPKVQLSGAPQKCQGQDPAINVGFTQNNNKKQCTGNVASTTFKWALCSCDDVDLLNNYLFDAFDSKKGPYTPGGFGGSVGSNGAYTLTKGEIYGSLWGFGSGGMLNQSPGQLEVFQQAHLNGPATYENSGTTHGDAFINGDVSGSNTQFLSDLTVPGNKSIDAAPQVQVSGQRIRQAVNINTVCDRCKPSNQIPIAQIVDNHRNNNDNMTIGLAKDALDQPGGPRVLELPCGKYFLNRIDVSDKVTIRATGRTALFVDGDLSSDNSITIRAERDAEIDVFIDGKATLQNEARIGAPAFPALNRFYVSGRWESFNNTALGAFVYAIDGGVDLKNNGEVFGGLYTQNLTTMNNTEIHYDRQVLQQKKKCCKKKGKQCTSDSDCCSSLICGNGTCGCVAKGGACTADSDCCSGRSCTNGTCGTMATDTGGGMDGGMDTASDTFTSMDADTSTTTPDGDSGTTRDADGGTTCVQEGGSCSADSECCSSLLCSSGTCGTTCSQEGESCGGDGDCCSPLVCDGGTCATDSCNNLYETCTDNSDCCSGKCGCSGSDCFCTES